VNFWIIQWELEKKEIVLLDGVHQKYYQKNIVSKASDVWSFGVTLWEVAEMKIPYHDILSNEEVSKRVINGSITLPKPTRFEIDEKTFNVMLSCWNMKYVDRPSFQHICNILQNGSEKKMHTSQIIITKEVDVRSSYVTMDDTSDSTKDIPSLDDENVTVPQTDETEYLPIGHSKEL